MTAREKLIRIIKTASPEIVEFIVKLMLKDNINPEDVTKPRTVHQ